MNIDKLITEYKYKNYLDRIQGSLSGHDLTLTDIKNYKRCGRSHKSGESTPDTIFCSKFGKHA